MAHYFFDTSALVKRHVIETGSRWVKSLVRAKAAHTLYIARITVDGGPGGRFTKRLDPRAQGRAAFKRKRLSHVTVVVSETAPAHPRKKRAGASVKAARATRRAPEAAASKPRRKRAGTSKRTAAAATTQTTTESKET